MIPPCECHLFHSVITRSADGHHSQRAYRKMSLSIERDSKLDTNHVVLPCAEET